MLFPALAQGLLDLHPVQDESPFYYKSQSAPATYPHALDLYLDFLPALLHANIVVVSLHHL